MTRSFTSEPITPSGCKYEFLVQRLWLYLLFISCSSPFALVYFQHFELLLCNQAELVSL